MISCLIGTPISNATVGSTGFTINFSGLYYLCESIVYSGSNPVISISPAANDVTLDLGGYGIQSGTARAIEIDSTNSVIIKNGFIISNHKEAIAVLNSEGVYISDIVADFSADVAFLINGCTEVTIDRCHFDNTFPVATGSAHPGKILINASSHAITVRDCDVYNPHNSSAGSAGFSVNITDLSSNKGEIRFERCYVRSDVVNGGGIPLTPYGFFISGVEGLSVVQKDCSATLVATGFYDTLNVNQTASTGEPLLWDSCVATLCTTGFLIDDGEGGTPPDPDNAPTNKILSHCVASKNSGDGFMVNNVVDVLFRGCIAQQNGSSGFEVVGDFFNTSGILFEECVSSFNTVDGFVLTVMSGEGLGSVNNVGFRFCTAANNGATGFECSAGGLLIMLKDCFATMNNIGIDMQSGTIFDTRSGKCAGNGAIDSLGGGVTVVSYNAVCV